MNYLRLPDRFRRANNLAAAGGLIFAILGHAVLVLICLGICLVCILGYGWACRKQQELNL